MFDNDNTIAKIYPDPRTYWTDVFIKTVEECGGAVPEGKEEEYMLAYYTKKGFMEMLEAVGLKTGWEQFQKAKGLVDERERIKYIQNGQSVLFKDAVDLIRILNERGIRYGVATFTTKRVVLEAFSRLRDLPPPQAFFDWNDSLRDNLEKPDPAIARIILKKLGVSAGSAVMVGDRLTDIQMGNMAGMITVLVKRREEDGDLVTQMEKEIEQAKSDPEELLIVPDHQVENLMEVEKLL